MQRSATLLGWAILGLLGGATVLQSASPTASARSLASGQTRTYPAGLNLISAPPGTDLSAALSLATLQPGDADYHSPPVTSPTVRGFGYWATFVSPTMVTLDEGSQTPYTVTAQPLQYFQIGNPSGTQAARVSGADAVYTFDAVAGSYTSTTMLQPGDGAWAISASGGTVTVTPGSATPVNPPATSGPAPVATGLVPFTMGHGYTLAVPPDWTAQPLASGLRITDAIIASPDKANTANIQIQPAPSDALPGSAVATQACQYYLDSFSKSSFVTGFMTAVKPQALSGSANTAGQATCTGTYTDKAGVAYTVIFVTAISAAAQPQLFALTLDVQTAYLTMNMALVQGIASSFGLLPTANATAVSSSGTPTTNGLMPFTTGHGYTVQVPQGWSPQVIPASQKAHDAQLLSPDGVQEIDIDVLPVMLVLVQYGASGPMPVFGPSPVPLTTPAVVQQAALQACSGLALAISKGKDISSFKLLAPCSMGAVIPGATAEARFDATYMDADGIAQNFTTIFAFKGLIAYVLQLQFTSDFANANMALVSAIEASFALTP